MRSNVAGKGNNLFGIIRSKGVRSWSLTVPHQDSVCFVTRASWMDVNVVKLAVVECYLGDGIGHTQLGKIE